MGVESNTDLDVFFDTDEFGEGFTTSAAATFDGTFDSGYKDDDEIESESPTILTKFSNVSDASLVRGLTVTRDEDSVDYKIREIKPDGTGLVTLTLERQ